MRTSFTIRSVSLPVTSSNKLRVRKAGSTGDANLLTPCTPARQVCHNKLSVNASQVAGLHCSIFDASKIEQWSPATWEAFTLSLLWHTCRAGVHGVRRFASPVEPALRTRNLLLDVTGRDTDRMVNDVLIRYCAAFLD